MEGTLMELVEGCPEVQNRDFAEDALMDKVAELENLGFKKAADEIFRRIELESKLANVSNYRYIEIDDEKILKFLNGKIEVERRIPKEKESFIEFSLGSTMIWGSIQSTIAIPEIESLVVGETVIKLRKSKSEDFKKEIRFITSNSRSNIGESLCWKETLIEEYSAVPPSVVLEHFKEHKDRNVFDFFTIATVEKIKDPLLLGRITGYPNRFFICQWGEDILLDDII